ncbi:MAG: acyltransferase [Lachnospiraceae bacterium]|nr:acyltransferase [Lachnospiraceae bacterium]
MPLHVWGGGKRVDAIDGLRGLSAIAIACIYHLATINIKYPQGLPFHDIMLINWIYRRGSIFVELFLVISGYMTFYSYTSKIDQGLPFPKYMLNRFFRIYPLMIATLIISTIGNLIYYLQNGHVWWWGGGQNTLTTFLFSILGIQALYPGKQSWNYPAWSLSVFFICWILYYALIKFTKNKKGFRIYLCIAIILIGIGLHINRLSVEVMLFNARTARGYIAFFSGGMVYYLQTLPQNNQKRNEWVAIFVLFIFILLHVLGVPTGFHTVVFGVAIFPAFIILSLTNKFLNQLLSLKMITYLGKISFSIYLCNYFIEIFTLLANKNLDLKINFSSKYFFFSNVVIHILIASLFYWIFENKIHKLLKQKYL